MGTTAHLLAQNYRPNLGLNETSVDEIWHVEGITNWTEASTVAEVLDRIPGRAIGAIHPDPGLSSAIVVNKSIYRKINPTDALVLVQFRTNHSTVRRVRSSRTIGRTSSVRVPNWANSNNEWVKTEQYEPREIILRVETRILRNGSLNDAAREEMFALVGTVFRFPDTVNGVPYLLKSPSISDFAPGQSRLVYTFETSCRIQPMAANTLQGQSLALPGLDYLQEWFSPDGHVGGVPLPIQVRRWQDRYPLSFQFQLPFL